MVKKRKQKVSKKFIPQASIVSDELYLPNHSGQLDAGTFKLTDGSVLFAENNKIAEDNFNLFWDDAKNQLEPNLIKITSDGSQAAPALKFNDTNTGFFKSGDSVRLSLNNSTKMTIDATGVGIGTASPTSPLDVKSTGTNTDVITIHSADGDFLFRLREATASGGQMDLADSAGNPNIRFLVGGNSFFAGGKVGIGTVNPGTVLHINDGTTTDQLRIMHGEVFGYKIGRNTGTGLLEFRGTQAGFTGYVFRNDDGSADLSILDSGNVGINTLTPTQPLSVKEKSGMSAIGGFCIKLTNKTGGNTVQGQLVAVYTTTAVDDAFVTCSASDDNVIGIVLDAGVSDGSEAWIVVSGIADVLIDAGGSARGDRMISSATAGSADVWNVGGAVATHFLEIGHCIETRAGAGLARCVLHFN